MESFTRKGPEFLMVLTATGPSYTREDGVHVVPLTRLGPRKPHVVKSHCLIYDSQSRCENLRRKTSANC